VVSYFHSIEINRSRIDSGLVKQIKTRR